MTTYPEADSRPDKIDMATAARADELTRKIIRNRRQALWLWAGSAVLASLSLIGSIYDADRFSILLSTSLMAFGAWNTWRTVRALRSARSLLDGAARP